MPQYTPSLLKVVMKWTSCVLSQFSDLNFDLSSEEETEKGLFDIGNPEFQKT